MHLNHYKKYSLLVMTSSKGIGAGASCVLLLLCCCAGAESPTGPPVVPGAYEPYRAADRPVLSSQWLPREPPENTNF